MTSDLWTSRPAHFWEPSTPVYFDEDVGAWQVFAYDDVLTVIRDADRFSNDFWPTEEARRELNPVLVGMWMTDGQRHRDLRAALAKPFRKSFVRSLTGEVAQVASELLDDITARGDGRFEAVTELAYPLPARVVCRLLGIDIRYTRMMHEWREEIYAQQGSPSGMPRQDDMAEALQRLIDLRRADPQPGMLDDLIKAQAGGYLVDGKPLSDWDIAGYVAMLIWAAYATTSANIADALLFLTEYGEWDALREDPSLVPGAVEEVLRWYPGFPGCTRLVLEDTVIGGQELKAGQTAIAWLTSANRDPDRFVDPDAFDIRRDPNPHIGFSTGRHVCLGAELARVELRAVVEQASQRMPNLRRDPDKPVRRRVWLEDSIDELHFLY